MHGVICCLAAQQAKGFESGHALQAAAALAPALFKALGLIFGYTRKLFSVM